EPNGLYTRLSSEMEGLANVKPGMGRSAMVDGRFVRAEYRGNAVRKVFHVEMEVPPTPDQLAQIEKLKTRERHSRISDPARRSRSLSTGRAAARSRFSGSLRRVPPAPLLWSWPWAVCTRARCTGNTRWSRRGMHRSESRHIKAIPFQSSSAPSFAA